VDAPTPDEGVIVWISADPVAVQLHDGGVVVKLQLTEVASLLIKLFSTGVEKEVH
jgi:hypothetical protein